MQFLQIKPIAAISNSNSTRYDTLLYKVFAASLPDCSREMKLSRSMRVTTPAMTLRVCTTPFWIIFCSATTNA